MTNKRELKKFIANTCGALAADMIMTGYVFPTVNPKDVQQIVACIAALQNDALAKCSLSFDKTPRDFATVADYHKARTHYFRTAYKHLIENFDKEVLEIVKVMNAAMPDDVRTALKEAVAE